MRADAVEELPVVFDFADFRRIRVHGCYGVLDDGIVGPRSFPKSGHVVSQILASRDVRTHLYMSSMYSSAISYLRSCSGSLSMPTALAALSDQEVTMFCLSTLADGVSQVSRQPLPHTHPRHPTVCDVIQGRESLCEQKGRLERGTRGDAEPQVLRHRGHC